MFVFVDITEEGRGSGVGMIAESGAKVSCERGGARCGGSSENDSLAEGGGAVDE